MALPSFPRGPRRGQRVRKLKQEKPPPAKMRRRWTLEEDKALKDLVLKKKSGGYKKIEDRDNRLMGSRAVGDVFSGVCKQGGEQFERPLAGGLENNLKDGCGRNRVLLKTISWRKYSTLNRLDSHQVYMRPVLENPEISEPVEALGMDLLMAVRDAGAKDVKEIPWERVLQALPGNQLAFNPQASSEDSDQAEE